ncbi:MAG: GatB/YqeY domain-containing protein [Leptospirales bacterium]|nr:GatB/YqeY domain-containing protein [Leptospirales bacterium]
MATLSETIQKDLLAAMKARSEVELSTLRMLKSDIQYELTRDGAESLTDEKVLELVRRGIKRRRESIEQFEKGGRAELAAQEKAEMAVLERYLPPSLSADAIEQVIAEVLAANAGASAADTGKIMGQVMGRLKGQNADGALVKSLVQKRLQS